MKSSKSVTTVLLISLSIAFSFISCSSDNANEPPEPPDGETNLPAKSVGVLPANGEPCSDYEEVANDPTKVLVAFQWNSAEFADSYILTVSENSDEIFRNTQTQLEAQVELDRGKTYTWQVTSVNTVGETIGDTFSFTTPGTPIGNFAPYAADINITFDSATFEMLVSWIGSDEDGDTLIYDVTIRANEEIISENIDVNADSLTPLMYTAGVEYSVKVISKDPSGNFSISVTNEKAPD